MEKRTNVDMDYMFNKTNIDTVLSKYSINNCDFFSIPKNTSYNVRIIYMTKKKKFYDVFT